MELSKKTTILFPPDLYARLVALAKQRNMSMGDLVRRACLEQYGLLSRDERIEAARALAALRLPVADPGTMKAESVPSAAELLP